MQPMVNMEIMSRELGALMALALVRKDEELKKSVLRMLSGIDEISFEYQHLFAGIESVILTTEEKGVNARMMAINLILNEYFDLEGCEFD